MIDRSRGAEQIILCVLVRTRRRVITVSVGIIANNIPPTVGNGEHDAHGGAQQEREREELEAGWLCSPCRTVSALPRRGG